MDALAGGRFVVPYELTSKGWHFTAFDARSGQRLWDVPLHSGIGLDEPGGFSLSATRVYVMRTSSVEVYDARTGVLRRNARRVARRSGAVRKEARA